jgi:glutaminase
MVGSTEQTMTLEDPTAFVSTGELPPPDHVRKVVDEAYERFASVDEGEPSQVYPALARAAPELFGIYVVGARGSVYGVGDADVEFTIMSVAKPFVFALVCAALGPEEMRLRVGVNATGLAFNSLAAIEHGDEGRTNPMVNPGAIATVGLVPGTTIDERWNFIAAGLSRFAGRPLSLDEDVFRSASETNHVNRSIANLLQSRGALAVEPADAVDVYTRQSSLAVTARDLATMGATLALGGVNPLTRQRVVDEETCRYVLAVMTTAGLYETSGDWLYEVGLPGKSGIGGGIITVAPGKGGLATFAPPLDRAGNSVRGQLAARFLSRALGLDIFMSRTEDAGTDT